TLMGARGGGACAGRGRYRSFRARLVVLLSLEGACLPTRGRHVLRDAPRRRGAAGRSNAMRRGGCPAGFDAGEPRAGPGCAGAGLEPAAVDLKSLCVARALTRDSCIFVDLMSAPAEVVLIDQHVPRVWHAFNAETDRDLARSIFDALRPVLGLSRRSGGAGFGPSSPIVVRADPPLVSGVATRLEELTGLGVL